MASKTSLLKQGVNKTGTGLFAGMTPMGSRENVEAEPMRAEQTITNDIEKEKQSTNAVNQNNESETKVTNNIVTKLEEHEPNDTKPESSLSQSDNAADAPINVSSVDDGTEVVSNETAAETVAESKNKRKVKNRINSSSTSPNSRYEKDKFLLLDIRGYRDYVEHMAKAANTSATKYIRSLIQQDMERNMDIYEAHKALEEKLKGRFGGV